MIFNLPLSQLAIPCLLLLLPLTHTQSTTTTTTINTAATTTTTLTGTWSIGFNNRTITIHPVTISEYIVQCNVINPQSLIPGCPDWREGRMVVLSQSNSVEIRFEDPFRYTLLGNIMNKGTTIRFDEGRHLSTWHRVFKDGERGKEEVVTKKETRATAAEKKKEKKVVSVTKQHDVVMDDQHSITKAKHGIFLTSLQDPWIGRSLRMYGQWSENELVSM